MKKSTSGFFSASQRWTGANASKMGAHTGSCCLWRSNAKPMVGVWEQATAPMMRAMGVFFLLLAAGPGRPLSRAIYRSVVGVETVVQIFLSEAVNKGRMTLPQFVRVSSQMPAKTWDVYPQKGSLQIGADADITLVDLNKEWQIDADKLHSRNHITPFTTSRDGSP